MTPMRNIHSYFGLLILFILSSWTTHAQEKLDYKVNLGFQINEFDEWRDWYGLALTIHPIKHINDRFKIEGRAGYIFTYIDSPRSSKGIGNKQTSVIQLGPRLLLNSSDNSWRPAISLLAGYTQLFSYSAPAFDRDGSGFSSSVNFDLEHHNMLFGMTLDVEDENGLSYLFRVAYTFVRN